MVDSNKTREREKWGRAERGSKKRERWRGGGVENCEIHRFSLWPKFSFVPHARKSSEEEWETPVQCAGGGGWEEIVWMVGNMLGWVEVGGDENGTIWDEDKKLGGGTVV
ncbi:hypothetical protein O3P69_001987 [Scylla paramamosain]|uniref:Uncharacterized protein n=1 Tax=Scylla paramamosain TaxID=85552 RepID=A0AAW0V3X4_SCYPA